ncbi:MAG: cytochrome c3 family protein [Nitrospirota bacterium]|nr:MAG: cytochrome c3 family protein [Nitrospirota bacterium]
MRNKATVLFLCVIIAVSLSSCYFTGENDGKEQAVVDERSAGIGISGLPCFGCHSPDRFQDQNVFPHSLHKEMGLHCNQCHIIKSHKSLALNGSTCSSCHDLSKMKLSLTSMPVTFNHGNHSAMFSCGDCHSDVFRMKVNSDKITMKDINNGRFCGECHNGKLASSAGNCGTCH